MDTACFPPNSWYQCFPDRFPESPEQLSSFIFDRKGGEMATNNIFPASGHISQGGNIFWLTHSRQRLGFSRGSCRGLPRRPWADVLLTQDMLECGCFMELSQG